MTDVAEIRSLSEFAADAHFVWNPRVACRTLDETAFILLQSKMVSLNEVGTYIWEHFKNASTVAQAATAVEKEFDVASKIADRDVREFVETLLNKALLTGT